MGVAVKQKLGQLKLVALALLIALGVAAVLPAEPVHADPPTCASYSMDGGDTDGEGTADEPCLVESCAQLKSWSDAADPESMGWSYQVSDDFSCNPGLQTIDPIGTEGQPFTGKFDGNDKTITNLDVSNGSDNNAGLFGYTSAATITNLTIDDGFVMGGNFVGLVVGQAVNGTSIKNVHIINGSMTATGNAGGIVGKLDTSTITYSSVKTTGVGNNTSVNGGLAGVVIGDGTVAISNSYIESGQVTTYDTGGGLVGYMQNAGIENSYMLSSVWDNDDGGGEADGRLGGLVGVMDGGFISKSYAAGSIISDDPAVGGLVGRIDGNSDDNTLSNNFAYVGDGGSGISSVGGIYGVADNLPTMVNNYYDQSASSHDTCYTDTDGGEIGCEPTNGIGNNDQYWLDVDHDPINTWDRFSTWNFHPDGAYFPTLFAEGEFAPAEFDSGNGTSSPYLISDCQQLQNMNNDLDANYAINPAVSTIDCSETRDWFGGKGFLPVGQAQPFTGNFDGNDKTITGLYIDRVNDTPGEQAGDESYVGLFGNVQNGDVKDIRLINARVRGYMMVGGVVGLLNEGTVENVRFNMNQGADPSDCDEGEACVWARFGQYGGGIVGYATNESLITDVQVAGPVKGSGITIGGVVGYMAVNSTVDTALSQSHVDGGEDIGGIVGYMENSQVIDSSATGDVEVRTDFDKLGNRGGGLVGQAVASLIDNSTANGDVDGYDETGGLVGVADGTAVEDSSASGDVTGSTSVGGFVGRSEDSDFINNSVDGSEIIGNGDNTGGFVGESSCGSTYQDSSASAEVSGYDDIGGFAGIDSCGPGLGATFQNIQATGNVYGYINAGGLIGNASLSTITETSATGDVFGVFSVGGLVGNAQGADFEDGYYLTVERSFATGNVTTDVDGGDAGGLIGDAFFVRIYDSYARGDVTSTFTAGGLVGTLEESYAFRVYTTGLVVSEEGVASGLVATAIPGWTVQGFWNTDSGTDEGGVTGTPKTSNELQTPATYADWASFDDNWAFTAGVNDDYPCLRWQYGCTPADFPDYNGDDIDDAEQNNVLSFINGYNDKTEAIELTDGCDITEDQVAVRKESQFDTADAGYDYGSSFIRFAATNCDQTITVKLFYYGVSGDFTVRKHNPDAGTYFTVPGSTTSQQTIHGQSVLVVSYELEDNGILDLNPTTGEVLDPVGLGTAVVDSPNTGLGI